MKRILIPSSGPGQWQALLGDPEKHWKRGRSAFETAVSWESAQLRPKGRGVPTEIGKLLDSHEKTAEAELLVAIPEHKVRLNNHRGPSQSDVWALLRNPRGLISLSVEAKAGESFDETVAKWLKDGGETSGRPARLEWLCEKLRVSSSRETCDTLRYQLFHRSAAAILEAERTGAAAAVMIVQAFPGASVSWADYEGFAKSLGVREPIEEDQLVAVPGHENPPLFLGWVNSPVADDRLIAKTLEG